MLVAFRVKPVEGICGNCSRWRDRFDFGHYGGCEISGNVTHYAHRCDVEEIKA